jgi:hypothetical protein
MQLPDYGRDRRIMSNLRQKISQSVTYVHILESCVDISKIALVRNIFINLDLAIEIICDEDDRDCQVEEL